MDATPTYRGQPANQGRLAPGPDYPGEGFAVLRCGNTEVVLGYTLLSHLRFELHKDNPLWGHVAEAQKALDAITCEASLGRTVPGTEASA
jgi:hypothetical protein